MKTHDNYNAKLSEEAIAFESIILNYKGKMKK